MVRDDFHIGDTFNYTLEKYSRVFVALGGFYDSPSLEDMVFAGELLVAAGITVHEMDDECREMFASASIFSSEEEKITVFTNNWIEKCLTHFGISGPVS